MSAAVGNATEDRILILTPTGRDGALAAQVLARAGMSAETCDGTEDLCARIEQGAAAAVVAEEALSLDTVTRLAAVVRAQPTWSDFPFLIFTSGEGTTQADKRLGTIVDRLGNLSFLERPLRVVTLISAVQGALRARRRQYELRDLLARREQEVRQRDHFLAMLGHELRNPLAAIIMAGEIMERTPSNAFERQRTVISRQSRHLARLVDDLLDVSRVTTGKIVLQRALVDLADVAQRGLHAAADSIAAQQLTVTYNTADEGVPINGDLIRVEQIFTNLITNAIKYTPRGGHIEVTVSRDGGEGVLRVRDTGLGLAPAAREHIFDLFMQVENTLERARGGLGIGLTVVRRLAQLHGGTVEAFSEGEGRGSEFVVRLPLHGGQREPLRPVVSAREPARHVVIVEDHTDFRELLQSTLESLGHRVETAKDGMEGLALVLTARPEIAIVDVGLPRLDGYSLAQKTRAALGQEVVLIALTGYGQPEDRERARDAGFDVHLTKPLDFTALQQALRGKGLPIAS